MYSLIDKTFPDLYQYLNDYNMNKEEKQVCDIWLPQVYYKGKAESLKVYTYDNSKKYLKNKKIFICGGCELSYVYYYLNYICNCYHTFESQTSMHILEELNNENSEIDNFNADYYILSNIQDIKNVLYNFTNDGISGFNSSNFQILISLIDDYFKRYTLGIQNLKKKTDKPIFIMGWLYLSEQPYFGSNDYLSTDLSEYEIHTYIQKKMIELCRNENIYLLNTDSMFERYNKFDCIESYESTRYGHLTYYGSVIFSEEFYNKISLLEKNLPRIKCVVMDCDNTLWNGILIEDGEEGLDINQKIVNILLSLVHRGIIISLCSKNNPESKEQILKIISNHWCASDLVKYIVSPKINWEPKSKNIKQIAKEINIGLDTIAFFDDSEFERREVNENAPEVNVFKDTDIYFCLNNPIFDNQFGKLTNSSKTRIDTYITNNLRNIDLNENSDKNMSDEENFINFMINSDFKLNIQNASENDVSRINELIQRTNQMNVTLKRTDFSDIKNFINDNNYYLYIVNLSDKYSDYGTVGTVILKKKDDNILEILEFAFSCRAMGKKVENSVLMYLFDIFNSFEKIIIDIKTNSKNNALIKLFEAYKFSKTTDSIYTHILSDNKYERVVWFS